MRFVTQPPGRALGALLLAVQCLLAGAPAPAQNTPEASAAMAAPVVFESGLHSLAVAWTAPAAADPPVTGYDLQYRATGSTDWTGGPQDQATTHAAIENLLKDTNYEVRVRANRGGDQGAWSQPGEGATALWTSALTVGAGSEDTDPTGYWGYLRRNFTFGHLNPAVFSYRGLEYDIFILSWLHGSSSTLLDFYTVHNPMPDDWVLRIGSHRFFAADAERATFDDYQIHGRAEKTYWTQRDLGLVLGAQYEVAISRASTGQDADSSLLVPRVAEPLVSPVTAGDSLTGAFENVPDSHDGSTPFSLGFRFSEPVRLSYTAFTSGLLDVTGGTVAGARRLNPYNRHDNLAWVITVTPAGDGDVVITMPADRACNPTGAPCTPNGRRLTSAPVATIPGPPPTASGDNTDPVATLTAQFSGAPDSHDGASEFVFELRFSENVNASYTWFADAVFTLSGGQVTGARRLTPPSNIAWEIRVLPDGNADVAIVLPADRDCAQRGAMCTSDGRTLEDPVTLAVPGPQPALQTVTPRASIAAGAGPVVEGAAASFTVSLDSAASTALSVPITVSETGRMLSGAPPGAVAVPAGQRTATVTLATSDDEVIEARSDVTVGLGAGDGFTVGTPSQATVTVQDNDTAAFRVSVAEMSIDEGGATTITVGIANGKTFAEAQSLSLSASGSASASDFRLSPDTLTLVSGSASATLTAVDDTDEEPAETVSIAVSLGGSVVGSATVTIRASDRALSDDATLSALSLSGIGIGAFSPSTVAYAAEVDNAVTATTVTARTNHAGASVRIDGSVSAVGSASRAVSLAVGVNRIAVAVTAEDGSALTYTVAVTRAEASAEAAAEGDLRLIGGSGPHEGRVEIFHSGRWGTVCDDFWSQNDAMVVCRQLGYTGRASALLRAAFGEGEDPIWLDNVGCAGDEARLSDCRSRGWGNHNCGHHEDAGVTCGASESATSLVDAFVAGDRLALRFAGALNAASTPSADDFVVLTGGGSGTAAVPVRDVSVSGATVVLGLGEAVSRSEDVSVSYLEAPMHPIEDDFGNPADPVHATAVRHEHTDDMAARGAAAAQPMQPAQPVQGPLAAPATPTARTVQGPGLLDAARNGDVKLERLDLSARNLSGVPALWGLADLERLELSGNAISDLSGLSALTQLERLDLSDNRIADIGALGALVNLRRLDLSNNRIADIGALAGLVNLRRLDLSDNRIADLSALAGLPRLEVVRVDGNAIEDLWAVAPLRAPVHLSLARNAIANVAPLAGFGSLKRLDLSGNRVVRVDALAGLQALAWLRLERNPVGSLAPLQGVPQLRWVWVDDESSDSSIRLPPGCCFKVIDPTDPRGWPSGAASETNESGQAPVPRPTAR